MAKNNISELSDKELISKIKEDIDFLGLVHKKCKMNALNFLKSKTGVMRERYNMYTVMICHSILLCFKCN